MKVVKKALPLTVLTVFAASPVLACDFHGAGFGGFYGGGWKPYSPSSSHIDPAMSDHFDDTGFEGEKAIGLSETSPFSAAARRSVRPTFSSVAMRASESALERRAKMETSGDESNAKAVKTAGVSESPSETDRQTIRN